MIIKGEFKTFGFWLSVISVLGGLFFFGFNIFWVLNNISFAGQLFFFLVFSILIGTYGKLLYDANIITIETANKCVTFKNILTRQHSTYYFSDFDGKLVWYKPIKYGRIRNLYLIKNKKAVKKISGFLYSNQKELENALIDIKDLGITNYSYLKSWKALFGCEIID